MLYIFGALYEEVQLFITQFSLKKIPENIRFREFCDTENKIRLVITGAGAIAAAAAVGYVFAKNPPEENDILLNIGSCAGKKAGVYFCHKLTEECTGRTYYPDIIYKHPFLEGELLTVAKPVAKEQVTGGEEAVLYDMEGAALYQAGAYFLGPHQMQFLKIVFDSGVEGKTAPEQLRHCMEEQREVLFAYVLRLLRMQETEQDWRREQEGLWPEKSIRRLSAALCCSKTMEETLKVYLHYALLQGKDIECIQQEFYREGKLPCKDKREGKGCFEELKARLLL